jgi:DNA-directed DNA polymerase III PolC
MYLNCKTYFSFRYGTFSTEELVKEGAEAGATSLALTNINNTCDAWDFVQFCHDRKIKPILGAEIRNGNQLLYTLLAANNNGLRWINEFLSKHLLEEKPFPVKAEQTSFFEQPADGFVIYPLKGNKTVEELLVNELIGVAPWEVNKLFGIDMAQHQQKFIVRQPVSFKNKLYYNLHRLLRAIDENCLLSKLSPEVTAGPYEFFVPQERILKAFNQYPFIIMNTYRVAERCTIHMDFGTDKNKKTMSATREDDRILLSKLAHDGLEYRYGKKNKVAKERLLKELAIIDQLGFNAYFLITYDIIRYARSRRYYYVGRGSGANSLVAYCLLITDVDPIELDLYFERFLNPSRTSPPDFDIDFSWLDRDDIIDYVFKRYGKDHVALLGMYDTFQYRAAVRELGKVFGLPKTEIDQLATTGYYNGDSRGESFAEKQAPDHIHKMILQYGRLLENYPNHLSIHPGGILISEEPIYNYTAIQMPPKGFPVAQLDMFIAENIGLYKLDILSQRGLGHIKEAQRLVRVNKGISINIDDVENFKKDPNVRAQIREVNTIGCFYIESPAMRQLLKKLKCDDYLTLVAASSIIRPGVSQSGMMHQYIERFHAPEKINYLHPKMAGLLKETFGVMVYQEDVIKVAHYFAGLDLGDADILRRAMSGKYRSHHRFLLIEEKYFSNCKALGYSDELAQEVWRQMKSFGAYSFSKAHSASFAVESFQSLFLKTYYPMEFMVAVINNEGGFYNTALYMLELVKTGASLHGPCVNNSEYFTHIRGTDVYVGFRRIKSLQEKLAVGIVEERMRMGAYLHLQDFIERTGVTAEQLNILIQADAFRFTGKNKKQLLWEANFLQSRNGSPGPVQRLFREAVREFKLPELPVYPVDDMYDQIELMGFPLCNPFELVDDDAAKYPRASDMKNFIGKTITVLGYHVTQKPVRTIHGDTMSFGTFMDVHLDWIDTVHFPEVHRMNPMYSGFYRITGKVVEEFSFCSIEVTAIEKIGIKKRNAQYIHA